MELDSWVHGLGFADTDASEVQFCLKCAKQFLELKSYPSGYHNFLTIGTPQIVFEKKKPITVNTV